MEDGSVGIVIGYCCYFENVMLGFKLLGYYENVKVSYVVECGNF